MRSFAMPLRSLADPGWKSVLSCPREVVNSAETGGKRYSIREVAEGDGPVMRTKRFWRHTEASEKVDGRRSAGQWATVDQTIW